MKPGSFMVVFQWLRSRSRRIAMALAFAVSVLAGSYFVDSYPLAVGGETATAQWIERVAYVLGRRPDHVPDSVLLVNVAYDKTLVPYDALFTADRDETRRAPAGHVAVTDRRKLADFLQAAAGAPYRYIVLDIRFDDDIPASDPASQRLFALIDSLPRVVFARHEDALVHPLAPAAKSAFSDYHTTVSETNMVKYPILKHASLSIPAVMYARGDSARFRTWGGLTFDRGRLCRRSVFIEAPVRASGWMRNSLNNPLGAPPCNYYNLGASLLAAPDSADAIRTLVTDRIVVVGDYIDDVHTTYAGTLAGPLVNLNAYIALCRGSHLVRILPSLLLFLLYFFIAYGLISRHNPFDYIPLLRRHRSVVLRAAVYFVGFTTLLSLTAVLFYIVGGTVYSVVFPSLCFTILNLWIRKPFL
ncbi:MAG: hypothetical protein K2F97_06390 [Muribaculaceae bacterium]|nr:hypothetical protein [Muribaculaceae bacterium]